MAKRKPRPRGPQLEMSGALGVAFVNTAGASSKNTQQGVESYADLLTWGQQAGVVSTLEADRLRRRAAEHPDEAEAVFARAARIRSALYRLFAAVARQEAMPGDELDLFNAALAAALPALRVVPAMTGLTWGWAGDGEALDRMLWPVLHSAAELLISTEGLPQVRQCAGNDCRLWFVDRTPSRQRHPGAPKGVERMFRSTVLRT